MRFRILPPVSAQAAADPVSITNGFLVATGQIAPVSVTGTRGFSVIGVGVISEGRIDPFTACGPCAAGSTVSVGGAFVNAIAGQATLDGNTYPLDISINAPHPMAWEFFGSTIAPPATTMRFALVEVPFTFSGLFFPIDSAPGVPLRGHGTVSLLFRAEPLTPGAPFAWDVDFANYNFSEIAATPEPASLTLIGLGLAVGAARRLRRRTA